MTPATAEEGSPARGGGGELQRRLVNLMAARLTLALVSLGVALVLDAAVADFTLAGRRGFYGTVALAFLATAIFGVVLPQVRRAKPFAAVNIATDIAMVSALVYLSGAQESPFVFLYVFVAVYGAFLFGRLGTLLTAVSIALGYGGVLLLARPGGIAADATPNALAMLLSTWLVHAGAVALVAALSSFLAAELRRTGEELERRTSDLRRLESLHQRTVESLMSGLLTTDNERRITSFNPEAENITGFAREDAIGRDVEEILPGIGTLSMERPGDRGRMSYTGRRDSELHLGVAAYILKGEAGVPGGHVVIFQDLTRVVEMEQELRRSERLAAVGELSASIAHEIRNPLAAISGSVQMLKRRVAGVDREDETGRLMDIVLREIDRLNHLISDFLHYARPRAPKLAPVSVAELVAEVLEVFRADCPPGVELRAEVEPELVVSADVDQLRQAIWNLVLNAAQAMPEGGLLEVRAGAEPAPQEPASEGRNGAEEGRKSGSLEICVSDEGVGIAPESRERIFDPFFTTKREGSGLGLATVHRIVETHGGSVRLDSRASGGTRVRMRFPLAGTPE